MAEKSFNGKVNTNGEWATLASVSGLTFTSKKFYTGYVGGQAELKIGEAIFPINNGKFYWTQEANQIYIKNNGVPTTLSIYGAE